jgi:type II secretory pathway component GspD/PulD (secretin)
MKIRLNICLIGLLVALTGCTLKESAKVSATVDESFVNAYEAFEMAKHPRAKVAGGDTVSMSEGVWLGNKSTLLEHKNNLPSKFESDTGITLLLNEPVTLQVLANDINSVTGIPVKIDSQVDSEKLKKTVDVAYTGKLSGLLSQIATDLDLLWYYDKDSIVFYETETRTYTLFALGTDVSYQSSVQTDSGNQVSLESTLKEWDEIEATINSIINNSKNAQFTVSRSLGTITVTASPSILSRVGEYITKQNKRLSQLVTIDVKVLQVSLNNHSAFGLNLAAAINSASGLNIVANPKNNLVSTETSSMNIAVLSNAVASATGIGGSASSNYPGYYYPEAQIRDGSLARAAGSNALIEALAKQGKVSLVTNVGVTTRNNRVAPVTNTKTTGYIKRFESRTFTTVESSTVDQDDLETGFAMQLLPNVLENGKILLLFKMSIRELLKMNQQTIGAVTLQLPEVEERSFMQEVIMESGQMLVVSGFEKQKNNDTRYGLGDADFMALSGSRDTEASREVLVVILTPQVLVSPMDAEHSIQQHWGAPLN